MLALLLGLVLAYETCDNVDSCLAQVNGTRPLHRLIGTMPNGGLGQTFTKTDCLRGLIALSDNCECKNTTIHASSDSPKYCYFTGDYSKASSNGDNIYCKEQNGLNVFSLTNDSSYMQCICFDSDGPSQYYGSTEEATILKPICKKGEAKYKPCSTDGTDDNAALLAPITGNLLGDLMNADLIHDGPNDGAFPSCQCGRSSCQLDSHDIAWSSTYCQIETEICSRYPACEEGKVFKPADLFNQKCQCGYTECEVDEKCQTEETDGYKKFVCTYKGGVASGIDMVKAIHGAGTLTVVFGSISFSCLGLVVIIWICTCLKVRAAVNKGKTVLQGK